MAFARLSRLLFFPSIPSFPSQLTGTFIFLVRKVTTFLVLTSAHVGSRSVGGVGGVDADSLGLVEGVLQGDGVSGLECGIVLRTNKGEVSSQDLPGITHHSGGQGHDSGSSKSKTHRLN